MIAHIDTARTWRGGQNQVFLLLKFLSEHARHIPQVLFTPDGSVLQKRLLDENIQVKIITFRNGLDFFRKALKYKKQYQLFHVHSSRAHNYALYASVFGRLKYPVLVHRRVDFPLKSGFMNQWKYQHPLVTGYIAISKCIYSILVDGGIPENKITLAHSGVNCEYLSGIKPRSIRDLVNADPLEKIFLNIGALTDHKGQIYLLEAADILWKKRRDFHIAICGEGELRPQFEDFIEKRQLQQCVSLLGYQTGAQAYLKTTDFFVMPSHLEGLGTTLIDALYLERPTIAARAGGMIEIVQDGRNGYLVPAKDPQALAYKMDAMLDMDPSQLQVMTDNATKDMLDFFSYQKMGKLISQQYEKMISLGGAQNEI